MPHHFHIATMGCQMNEYDSDYLSQLLINDNFIPTDNLKIADLILINTCTVRAKAEQKAYSLLGRMLSLKKRKPQLILGLMGCIAQQEESNLLRKFKGLDLVLGTREIDRIQEILERIYADRKRIVATKIELKPPPFINSNGYFKGRVKNSISIMQGCNNFCSYCVVPYVRGREVSRPPEEILKEAEHLISHGIKEITLLGQNVNSYCWGPRKGCNFPSLLRKMSKLDGLVRIRFTTSHPKDLSRDLSQCFGELDNLCPHIHLPFQAGSNRILELMNRGYTREKYMELIRELREVSPGIAITSDVMVGFPGERNNDFLMTLDLIKKIEFDSLYSFKYSDRKGTLARKMYSKIDEVEKSSRLKVLQQLQKGITLRKNKCLEGMEFEILVEGRSKKVGQLTGRTNTNKVINFTHNNKEISNFVKVKIKRAFVNSLWGELTKLNA
ncbi:MAG: tRNA (N6-isopentenyl adenosine(37)-C2)-methylthiotransferase MiaB [Desulfatiglandales bacterium]|nr:tRNA (N6-isopentenyl adenosine(37)-C2)-methylthiotransferase MiaB [Desulfatiglandales bacterium]